MRNLSLLTTLVLALAPWQALHAAESYDGCQYEVTSLPAVLTTQGVWCLKSDLATAITSGAAITLANNNITLDCNHYKLGGLAAGAGTAARGILSDGRSNNTVRNCNIRGFYMGIQDVGGYGLLAEDNRLESNTFAGIYSTGVSTLIRRNRISYTGESSLPNVAYGIRAYGDSDIIDNIISGVYASTDGNYAAYGIYTTLAAGSITSNRIRDVVAGGTAASRMIWNSSSRRVAIDRNYLHGTAAPGSVGVSCSNSNGLAFGNQMLGIVTGTSGCSALGNYVDVD